MQQPLSILNAESTSLTEHQRNSIIYKTYHLDISDASGKEFKRKRKSRRLIGDVDVFHTQAQLSLRINPSFVLADDPHGTNAAATTSSSPSLPPSPEDKALVNHVLLNETDILIHIMEHCLNMSDLQLSVMGVCKRWRFYATGMIQKKIMLNFNTLTALELYKLTCIHPLRARRSFPYYEYKRPKRRGVSSSRALSTALFFPVSEKTWGTTLRLWGGFERYVRVLQIYRALKHT